MPKPSIHISLLGVDGCQNIGFPCFKSPSGFIHNGNRVWEQLGLVSLNSSLIGRKAGVCFLTSKAILFLRVACSCSNWAFRAKDSFRSAATFELTDRSFGCSGVFRSEESSCLTLWPVLLWKFSATAILESVKDNENDKTKQEINGFKL